MDLLNLLQLLCSVMCVMLILNVYDLILYRTASNAMKAYMEAVNSELELHLMAISALEKQNEVLRNKLDELENYHNIS